MGLKAKIKQTQTTKYDKFEKPTKFDCQWKYFKTGEPVPVPWQFGI